MRMKRTAALALALVLGTMVLIVSLFVERPAAAEMAASVDPITEVDADAGLAAEE